MLRQLRIKKLYLIFVFVLGLFLLLCYFDYCELDKYEKIKELDVLKIEKKPFEKRIPIEYVSRKVNSLAGEKSKLLTTKISLGPFVVIYDSNYKSIFILTTKKGSYILKRKFTFYKITDKEIERQIIDFVTEYDTKESYSSDN